MKRTAFTLTELMVVVAIIVLLVAILLPSLSQVPAFARSSLCKNNLKKLGDAFTMVSASDAMNEGMYRGSGSGKAVTPFPEGQEWPGVPKIAVSDSVIFRCPEEDPDESEGDMKDMFALMEYVNPYGQFPMNTTGSKAFLYVAQTGTDPVYGAYTEFLLQDDNNNGQFEKMAFNSWWDTDGYVRVYHSGHIWVPSEIPVPERANYPGAGGPGYPDRLNACPDVNIIHFRGKPAFGSDGHVQHHRGQKGKPGYKLDQWMPWLANYGISSEVYHYPFGTKALVLVDYPELMVDLDGQLTDVDKKLAEGARHLNKVNALWADGSVSTQMPLTISPSLNPEAWAPTGTPRTFQ